MRSLLAVVVAIGLIFGFCVSVLAEASIPGTDLSGFVGNKWGPHEWFSPRAEALAQKRMMVAVEILEYDKEKQEVTAKYSIKGIPPGYVIFKAAVTMCKEGPCFIYKSTKRDSQVTFILLKDGAIHAVLTPQVGSGAYFTETIIPRS